MEKNPNAQKLIEVFHKIKKLHMKQHSIEGIKPNEFFVMVLIRKGTKAGMPGLKVSDISNQLHVTPPTVTQVITGLENQGYVERSMDKEDRRAVRINLTEKGDIFMDKAYENYISTFNGLAEYLGEEKSNTLIDLLSEVLLYLNDNKK